MKKNKTAAIGAIFIIFSLITFVIGKGISILEYVSGGPTVERPYSFLPIYLCFVIIIAIPVLIWAFYKYGREINEFLLYVGAKMGRCWDRFVRRRRECS